MAPDNPMTTPGIIWRSDDLTTPIEGWRGTLEIRAGSAVDSTTGPLAELARLRAENEKRAKELDGWQESAIAKKLDKWRESAIVCQKAAAEFALQRDILQQERDSFGQQLISLRAENERLKADAARFQWMLDNPAHESMPFTTADGQWCVQFSVVVGGVHRRYYKTLDAAIDAAMSATAPPAR